MNTILIIDNLQRIIAECHGLFADKCPPAPHACPKCEILHLAEEALREFRYCGPDASGLDPRRMIHKGILR